MSNHLTALKARITRLRLSNRALAGLSGLHEDTVCRALGGKNVHLATFERLEQAVGDEEGRLVKTLAPALQPGAAA